MIKVTDWLNNVTTYTYDFAGNLSKTTYPNGYTITYQYDEANRLKSIVDAKPDGTVNAAYGYTFDQLGNRTITSYYQPLNAIPPSSTSSYTHEKDNRLLTAGDITFGYDNNGNLTTKTVGSNVTNYTWDYDNMLTQVVGGGNTYVYKYDGFESRVSRIENSAETRYVVNPRGLSKILAETDATGNITAYFAYGLGLISKITPSDQAYYYHFDGIGNTIAMTDSTGAIVNKYAYDEFGKVLNQEETISNPFKYVGQFGVMDEENGLFYMRARYYDSEIGRFVSKDPKGFEGGSNLYSYVQGNPLNFVDPPGEGPIAVGACVVLTIGDAIYTGYSINKLQKEIEELRGMNEKLNQECQKSNLSGKELEGYFDQINEIDRQIIKKLKEQTQTEMIGIYVGGAVLAIFCAASPFLPF